MSRLQPPLAGPPTQQAPAGLPLHVHLLIVDDDDVDRERVLRLLGRTSLSFDAKEAATPGDALNLLRAHDFDCVMLDNRLGDTSGAALLPAIRQATRQPCPVIMITGAGNESLAVHALQQGAADYLTKFNLDADVLGRSIRRALEHHRMRQELDDLHLQLEQRVAQQAAAIRQRERDLRATLDHTPTVIGSWDRLRRNRFGNQAWRAWAGIDPAQLPGRHFGEVMAGVIGAAALARIEAQVQAVLDGESRHFELAQPADAGQPPRHAQWSLHPDLADDGSVRGFYSSITDVSGIRAAQARAEELAAVNDALFAESPVGLCLVDAAGHCLRANAALAQLLGARVGQLVGLPLDGLAEGCGDLTPLMAAGQATLADGLPRRLEVDLRTVFGSRLQASCAWARVERDGRGQALLALQDVAEQRRAHAALVAARDAAEQATRAKSQFLANMSHEIRTPMNAIVGLTQLALADPLPPGVQGYIDTVHQSARALMGILDDVLDYSKVEAGALRLEQMPLDLAPLVQRAIDLFSARCTQKGLQLELALAPGLPRRVLGDPLRLSQVLNNLLGNAVKFTERGSVRLAVDLLQADGAAPTLRFAVHDTGAGIPPAEQAGLFAPFTQADNSITRRFGGTGLGLAICRRLVEMMGGQIGLQSTPGAGSVFWFAVPLVPAPGGATDPPPAAPAAADLLQAGARPLQGLHLLLVEDNDTNRLVAGVWLERLGAAVEQAMDGAQALGRLQQPGAPPFDAVLMDMHMPVMDGLAATRRLRSVPALADLPVIGMTAAALAEDRALCLAAGMVDHVTKPIVVEQLVATLLHWTGRAARPPAAPPSPPVPPPPQALPTDLPGFELGALRELLHGDEAMLRRLLRRFAVQEAGAAAGLAAQLARQDIDGACRHLHTLRGGAGSLGALQLAEASAVLEQALRSGRPHAAPLAAFDAALGRALAAIAALDAPSLSRG